MTIDEVFDEGAIKVFTDKMSAKLEVKRMQGRGGWFNDDIISVDALQEMLQEHVDREDWVDVANLAMMLYFRRAL